MTLDQRKAGTLPPLLGKLHNPPDKATLCILPPLERKGRRRREGGERRVKDEKCRETQRLARVQHTVPPCGTDTRTH